MKFPTPQSTSVNWKTVSVLAEILTDFGGFRFGIHANEDQFSTQLRQYGGRLTLGRREGLQLRWNVLLRGSINWTITFQDGENCINDINAAVRKRLHFVNWASFSFENCFAEILRLTDRFHDFNSFIRPAV